MTATAISLQIMAWQVMGEAGSGEAGAPCMCRGKGRGQECPPYGARTGVCALHLRGQECPRYGLGGRECAAHTEDLWLYRDRTVALLKRYARASVEVGRLPSLLGRECFRSRVTSYSMTSFEDIVIFVHDVETAVRRLDEFHQRLIEMNVLEEYSLAEVARLLPCPLRTVEREVPEALDELTRMLLSGGLINEVPSGAVEAESCQEGKNYNFPVSVCNEGKNIRNYHLHKPSKGYGKFHKYTLSRIKVRSKLDSSFAVYSPFGG